MAFRWPLCPEQAPQLGPQGLPLSLHPCWTPSPTFGGSVRPGSLLLLASVFFLGPLDSARPSSLLFAVVFCGAVPESLTLTISSRSLHRHSERGLLLCCPTGCSFHSVRCSAPEDLPSSSSWGQCSRVSRLQERNGDFQVAEDSGDVLRPCPPAFPPNSSEEQEGEIELYENQALGVKDTMCPNLKTRKNPNPSVSCLVLP